MDISKIVKKIVEGNNIIYTVCPSHGQETKFTYIGACDWGTDSIPGMKEYPLEDRAQYNCHCDHETTGTTLSLSSLMKSDPTLVGQMRKQNLWTDYTKAKWNVKDIDGNVGNFTWSYLLAVQFMNATNNHGDLDTFMEKLSEQTDTIKSMSQLTNYCESGLRTGIYKEKCGSCVE